jgi:hypothetical protein
VHRGVAPGSTRDYDRTVAPEHAHDHAAQEAVPETVVLSREGLSPALLAAVPAGAGAESLHRAAIMRLQSAAGNAAVGRVLSRQEQNASPRDPEVGFKQRADDVSAKLDAAGLQLGNPLRGTGTAPSGTGAAGVFPEWFRKLQWRVSMTTTWGDAEEDAQGLLRDYATWKFTSGRGGELPPNLKVLFDYVGRSSINAGSASLGKYKSAAHFGGGIAASGKPTANWCTQTTSTGALDALKEMHSKLGLGDLPKQKLADGKSAIAGPGAYDVPLHPGDLVMYLFDSCQYGGHTVTVIDDQGDAFTHVSGNTGDAIMIGIGESKRLKHPPRAKTGSERFNLAECNKVSTAEERTASTEYIKKWDFEGSALTYSIIRYGDVLAQEASKLAASPAPAE